MITEINEGRDITDAIKDYIIRNRMGEGYKGCIYSIVSNAVNRAVYGEVDINSHSLDADSVIESIETYAMLLIDKRGVAPLAAIEQAIELYL